LQVLLFGESLESANWVACRVRLIILNLVGVGIESDELGNTRPGTTQPSLQGGAVCLGFAEGVVGGARWWNLKSKSCDEKPKRLLLTHRDAKEPGPQHSPLYLQARSTVATSDCT
jgi:hypothetical protein